MQLTCRKSCKWKRAKESFSDTCSSPTRLDSWIYRPGVRPGNGRTRQQINHNWPHRATERRWAASLMWSLRRRRVDRVPAVRRTLIPGCLWWKTSRRKQFGPDATIARSASAAAHCRRSPIHLFGYRWAVCIVLITCCWATFEPTNILHRSPIRKTNNVWL